MVRSGATLTVRVGFAGKIEAVLRWPFAQPIQTTGSTLASALEVLELRASDDAASDLLKAGGA